MNFHLIIISFLEGLTEFLPISSTAHLIIASKILSIDTTDSYIKFYLLFIQIGALAAGIILFSKKVFSSKKVFVNICISFIPSAIAGFILYKLFKKLLEGNMILLATMLFIGGCIFVYLEKVYMKRHVKKHGHHEFGKSEMSKTDALIVGIAQALAIVPGVSRSGATIIAGIFRGVKKTVIIEYTFMLALPTLGAAVVYDAYKTRDVLMHLSSFGELLTGLVVSFVVALGVLIVLEKTLKKIPLIAFGYYRIILAIIVLSVFAFNIYSSSPSIAPEIIKDLPSVSILPTKILPGDPLMVVVNASSSPREITYDTKKVSVFTYNNKSTALIPIPFEERRLDHTVQVTLVNGMVFKVPIHVTLRKKIEKPLGIPEKLGGNTPAAGQSLVNNLAVENSSLNTIQTSPTILWKKSFISPLLFTKITDAYGYSRNTVGYTITHKGTDFRASVGTEVRAMNSGIVRVARLFTVYGNTIVLDHGMGLNTLYMHLSKINVVEGQKVEIGQIIGLSGQTGYADAAHLHVSVKINGVSIDPARFLSFF